MLIVRGRRVVVPGGEVPASIHIEGGRIVSLGGADDVPAGADVVDCGDLIVSPGIVDSHVHVNEPGRTEWEGFDTATHAAAAGGVTTLVDMPLNSIPATTTAAADDQHLMSPLPRFRQEHGLRFAGPSFVPRHPGRLASAGPQAFEGLVIARKRFEKIEQHARELLGRRK